MRSAKHCQALLDSFRRVQEDSQLTRGPKKGYGYSPGLDEYRTPITHTLSNDYGKIMGLRTKGEVAKGRNSPNLNMIHADEMRKSPRTTMNWTEKKYNPLPKMLEHTKYIEHGKESFTEQSDEYKDLGAGAHGVIGKPVHLNIKIDWND